MVAAKKNAAIRPQNHWLGESVRLRNAVARAAAVLRGGPPPPVHQRKSPRNIASANVASGTPRFSRKIGHTLTAATVMRRPEMIARSDMGNLAQPVDG